jgi:HD-like signal output (HDOD) protein
MGASIDTSAGRTNAQRLAAHCRRVRAVAVEFACRSGATIQEQRLIADAAIVHHYPAELLSSETIGSTLTIMQRQCRIEPQTMDASARRRALQELLKVLKSFHSMSLNHRGDTLPGLLTAANWWVELLEAPRTGVDPRDAALETIRRKSAEGLVPHSAFRAALNLPKPRKEDLARTVTALPVYPALALRVLALAAGDQVSFSELAALVSRDQVLAGHLVGAANSCVFSPVGQISTVPHAISYIGLEETRRVITAAAMRPLFAAGGIAELWKHSLEVSRWCEDLSAGVRGIAKDEAFLAGLVHDVGRLLALKHSGDASRSFVQLTEQGCDPPFAETCIFGCDHAEFGARVLEVWKFPQSMVEAVRCHHRPEESKTRLASLLYLAESRESEADTGTAGPSFEYALTVTGIDRASLDSARPDIGLLRSMAFAA